MKTNKTQLNIFELLPFEEEPEEIATAAKAAAVKPKRARKKREAKKAPMLVDAFDHNVTEAPRREPVPELAPLEKEPPPQTAQEPRIYTVSEITDDLKSLIEDSYPDIWLTGEVTDFKNRTGRHYYFALKDERNKIRTVMFGAGSMGLKFELTDGLEVVCHGKLNLYGPQGQYSVLIDFIEPKGKGALQLAFEQLKKKLEDEGLFARERKRPLPYLPRRIGVITSPTGAAIRDMVHVLCRRFPNIEVLLYPVRVQGEGAAPEIAAAIHDMNLIEGIDLLIVGRGGGSIEDLWAFNEEIVARAIAASKLPVISAVGHEIDFTIADFVADIRAATPSAAAEIAVPVRDELIASIGDKRRKLTFALSQVVITRAHMLKALCGKIIDPRRRLPDLLLRIDSLRERVIRAVNVAMEKRAVLVATFAGNLGHLSPLAVLAKGYAVVEGPDKRTISSAAALKPGDNIGLKFRRGHAEAKVTKVIDPSTACSGPILRDNRSIDK